MRLGSTLSSPNSQLIVNGAAAVDSSPSHLANMNQPLEEHEDDGDSLGEGDLFEAPVAPLSANPLIDAALKARKEAESNAPAAAAAAAAVAPAPAPSASKAKPSAA